MSEISFTKEEMVDLLIDYANNLYENHLPPSLERDNLVYVKDYVDGYFEGYLAFEDA